MRTEVVARSKKKSKAAEPRRLQDSMTVEDIRKRFEIGHGQILFDGRDLELPTGRCVTVLTALIHFLGRVVPHAQLDSQSMPYEASVEVREAIMKIRSALKTSRVPCRIDNRRGEGYMLRLDSRAGHDVPTLDQQTFPRVYARIKT